MSRTIKAFKFSREQESRCELNAPKLKEKRELSIKPNSNEMNRIKVSKWRKKKKD